MKQRVAHVLLVAEDLVDGAGVPFCLARALVRRLIEKLTVYVEVLLIMVRSGLEITVDNTLRQSEMIRLLFLVLQKDINAHRQKNKKLPICVDGKFHKCYTKYWQKII